MTPVEHLRFLIFAVVRVSNAKSRGIPLADAGTAGEVLVLHVPLETWLYASTSLNGMAETTTLASPACQALAVHWTYHVEDCLSYG